MVEPHVFDNTDGGGVPARMSNFGATYNSYCTSEVMTTDGDLLMGGSQMLSQKSCSPNTGNVGNYYGWVTAVTGDDASDDLILNDSICPKGWQMPNGGSYDIDKSFASITYLYVGILRNESGLSNTYDINFRQSAASYIKAGYYNSSSESSGRGGQGYIWSSQAKNAINAYRLSFSTSAFGPINISTKSSGYSVRCVAR